PSFVASEAQPDGPLPAVVTPVSALLPGIPSSISVGSSPPPTTTQMTPIQAWEANWRAGLAELVQSAGAGGAFDNPNPLMMDPALSLGSLPATELAAG